MVKRLSAERCSRFERPGSTTPLTPATTVLNGRHLIVGPPDFKNGVATPRQGGGDGKFPLTLSQKPPHQQIQQRCPTPSPSPAIFCGASPSPMPPAPPPVPQQSQPAPRLQYSPSRSTGTTGSSLVGEGGKQEKAPEQKRDDDAQRGENVEVDAKRDDDHSSAPAARALAAEDSNGEKRRDVPDERTQSEQQEEHAKDDGLIIRSLSAEAKKKRIEIYKGVKNARKKATAATKQEEKSAGKRMGQIHAARSFPDLVLPRSNSSTSDHPKASSQTMTGAASGASSNKKEKNQQLTSSVSGASFALPSVLCSSTDRYGASIPNSDPRKDKTVSSIRTVRQAPSLRSTSPMPRQTTGEHQMTETDNNTLNTRTSPSQKATPNKQVTRVISPPHLRPGYQDAKMNNEMKKEAVEEGSVPFKSFQRQQHSNSSDKVPSTRAENRQSDAEFSQRQRKTTGGLERIHQQKRARQHRREVVDLANNNGKPRATGRANESSAAEERLLDKLQRARGPQHPINPLPKARTGTHESDVRSSKRNKCPDPTAATSEASEVNRQPKREDSQARMTFSSFVDKSEEAKKTVVAQREKKLKKNHSGLHVAQHNNLDSNNRHPVLDEPLIAYEVPGDAQNVEKRDRLGELPLKHPPNQQKEQQNSSPRNQEETPSSGPLPQSNDMTDAVSEFIKSPVEASARQNQVLSNAEEEVEDDLDANNYKKPLADSLIESATEEQDDSHLCFSAPIIKKATTPLGEKREKKSDEKIRRSRYDKAYIKSLLSESPTSERETLPQEKFLPQSTPTKSENTKTLPRSTAERSPIYNPVVMRREEAVADEKLKTANKMDEQLETESSVFNFSKNDLDEDTEKYDLGSSIFSFPSNESNKIETEPKARKEVTISKPKTPVVPDDQEERAEVELEFEGSESIDCADSEENETSNVTSDIKNKFSIRALFPGKVYKSKVSSSQLTDGTPSHRKLWTPVFKNMHVMMGQRTPVVFNDDVASHETPTEKEGEHHGMAHSLMSKLGHSVNHSSILEPPSSHRHSLWTPSLHSMIGHKTKFFSRGKKINEKEKDDQPLQQRSQHLNQQMKQLQMSQPHLQRENEEKQSGARHEHGLEKTESKTTAYKVGADDVINEVLGADEQRDPAMFKFSHEVLASHSSMKEESSKADTQERDALANSTYNTVSQSVETSSTGYRIEATSTDESQSSNPIFEPNKLCICGPKPVFLTEEEGGQFCPTLNNCGAMKKPTVNKSGPVNIDDFEDYSATSSKESIGLQSAEDSKEKDLRDSFSGTLTTLGSSELVSKGVGQATERKKRRGKSMKTEARPSLSNRPPLPPHRTGDVMHDKTKKPLGVPPIAFRKQRSSSFDAKKPGSSRNVITSSTFTHTGTEQVETLLRIPDSNDVSVAHSPLIHTAIDSQKRSDVNEQFAGQVNGSVFNVRISLAYLYGLVTTAYKRPRRRQSEPMVTAYAHVDFSSATATQASQIAVSNPITPIYSQGQVHLSPIVWSGGASAIKSQGRLYFSVLLEKQSGRESGAFSPETICLVVGVKCGAETIPLGLVSFTIDGTEISGRRVNFAVQPNLVEPEKIEKGGPFKLGRRKTPKHSFQSGDHMYALDSSAILSARVDVTGAAQGAPGPSLWNDEENDVDSFIHSVLDSVSVAQTKSHDKESQSCSSSARRKSSAGMNHSSNLPPSRDILSEHAATPIIKNSHSSHSGLNENDTALPESITTEKVVELQTKTGVIDVSLPHAKKWSWVHHGKASVDQDHLTSNDASAPKKLSVRKAIFPTLMRVKRIRNSFGGHSLSSQDTSIVAHSTLANGAPYEDQARILTVNTKFSLSTGGDEGGDVVENSTSSTSDTYDGDTSKKSDDKGASSWMYHRAKDVGLITSSSDDVEKIETFSFSATNVTHMQPSDLSESAGTSTKDGSSVPDEQTRSRDSRSYDSRTSGSASGTMSGTMSRTLGASRRTEATTTDTLDEFKKILWIAKKLDMKPDTLIDRLKAGEDIEAILRNKI